MFSLILMYSVVIGYFGITMYLANQEQLTGKSEVGVRMLLYSGAGLIFLLGFYVVLLAVNDATLQQMADQGQDVTLLNIEESTVVISVIMAVIGGAFAIIVINSEAFRESLAQFITGEYHARSIVHTTAIVLCLLLMIAQIVLFLVSGGIEGMAENLESTETNLGEPVFQALLQVAAAFLGIGFAIRRDLPQALERLGLRMPNNDDLRVGVLSGVVLIVVLIIFNIGLSLFQPADQIEEQNQAAESLALAFATPLAALVLSTSAAVGEEIFFRGALQPIFGKILTSVIFVLMHTQVLITPGLILLFIVSYVLAWVREQYSTTAAIISHFVYNFIQLVLLILALGAT